MIFMEEFEMPIDPKAMEILQESKKNGGWGVFTRSVEELRASMPSGRALEDAVSAEDLSIPTLYGNMFARIYRPIDSSSTKGMVFYHGGGFVLGSLESHDGLIRNLAKETDRVVVAPEYRLAPEHKYPAAVEDAISTAQWVYDNCAHLGFDRNTLAVCGDSAGGTLAASTSLYFKRRGGVKFQKQVLIYPVTDFVIPGTASLVENDPFAIVNRDFALWSFFNYITPETNMNDPYLFPLRAEDLADLPATFVLTSEFDILRDEGECYAEKLSRAGTSVLLKRYEGMMHSFMLNFTTFKQARTALKDIAEFL
jgi:acetyl esterase